jgi:hypothetical protein
VSGAHQQATVDSEGANERTPPDCPPSWAQPPKFQIPRFLSSIDHHHLLILDSLGHPPAAALLCVVNKQQQLLLQQLQHHQLDLLVCPASSFVNLLLILGAVPTGMYKPDAIMVIRVPRKSINSPHPTTSAAISSSTCFCEVWIWATLLTRTRPLSVCAHPRPATGRHVANNRLRRATSKNPHPLAITACAS